MIKVIHVFFLRNLLLIKNIILLGLYFEFVSFSYSDTNLIKQTNALVRQPTKDEIEMLENKLYKNSKEIEKMFNSNIRIIWCRDFSKSPDSDLPNSTMKLMRYSFNKYPPEEEILPNYSDYFNPSFLYNGEKVIFSQHLSDPEVWIVNYDGTKLEYFAKGIVIGNFYDSKDNKEWIYIAKVQRNNYRLGNCIVRKLLDSNAPEEVVLNKINFRTIPIMFNLDASLFTIQSFDYKCGYFDIIKQVFVPIESKGNYPMFVNVSKNIFATLIYNNRRISFFDITKQRRWQVGINPDENFDGESIKYIRCINYLDNVYFIFSTSYYVYRSNIDAIPYDNSKIYLAKLSKDMAQFEKYIPLTLGTFPDYFPAFWVYKTNNFSKTASK